LGNEAAKRLEDLAPETEADDQSLEEAFDLEVNPTGELPSSEAAGPVFAELIATRAELKRVETEVNELRDSAEAPGRLRELRRGLSVSAQKLTIAPLPIW
jgi:hypothetical protein